MFGNLSPSVKNLLGSNNEWRGVQTFTNPYPATSSSANDQKSSPAQVWIGQGYKTAATAGSHAVGIRQYVKPESGTTTARPVWQLDTSVDGKTWVNAVTLSSGNATALTTPTTVWQGTFTHKLTSSNTIASAQGDHLILENPSGSQTNFTFKFGASFKAGIGVSSSGQVNKYSTGPQVFVIGGSSIPSGGTTVLQLTNTFGAYNYLNGVYAGTLSVGNGDTTPAGKLAVYGSTAVKGIFVTDATYTLGVGETAVYTDPSLAVSCAGTPTACSTYVSEGTCNAHSGVGCSWSAGTSCTVYNGDQSSCEGQAGCTWTGEYDCGSYFDSSSCNALLGCSWMPNYADCSSAFFDEFSCNAQSGCTWDGFSCSGTYDDGSGSCSGGYVVVNECSGTFGAGCLGTAACSNLTDDGESTCEAEGGCAWVNLQTLTLPTAALASRQNTSRFYAITHIGTGTVNIQAGAGDTILKYGSTLSLNKKGDHAILHYHQADKSCAEFATQGACEAIPSGQCTWSPSDSCANYFDESSCNAANGGGTCSWDGFNCQGGDFNYSCVGTYVYASGWMPWSLERGKNYVEKTATYTVTEIDDIVNCTSGTFTLNLPSAVTMYQKQYILKNTGAGTITIDGNGSQTIDGSTTVTLTAGQSKIIESNGANWIIVGAF